MPVLEIAGLQYAYQLTGSGEYPPLVLLHGFSGRSDSWAHLIPMFVKNRLVLAVDLPGHGGTYAPEDPARIQMAMVAADLAGLVTGLSLVESGPLDILGYSMGGRLALYFALYHPELVRRLVLESASPGLDNSEARRARQIADEELALRIETKGIEAFVTEWEELPLFASQASLPADLRAGLHQRRMENHPAGLAASLRGMGTGVQPSLWPHLSGLHCPVLLICGDLDAKFTTINREMHTAIPHSVLHIIPGAGHTPHLEAPEIYQKLVIEFLESA